VNVILTPNVQITKLVFKISVEILVWKRCLVEKVLNVNPKAIELFVDVQMDGEAILPLNATHVGFFFKIPFSNFSNFW